jgi:hypothetical protein
MCERPVGHRLLQQRTFEDSVILSVRQLLELLGSFYVFGNELHVGPPSKAGVAFYPQRASRMKGRAPSRRPDHFHGMTIMPGPTRARGRDLHIRSSYKERYW